MDTGPSGEPAWRLSPSAAVWGSAPWAGGGLVAGGVVAQGGDAVAAGRGHAPEGADVARRELERAAGFAVPAHAEEQGAEDERLVGVLHPAAVEGHEHRGRGRAAA